MLLPDVRIENGTYGIPDERMDENGRFVGKYIMRNGETVEIDSADSTVVSARGFTNKGRALCWNANGNNAVSREFDLMKRVKP